MDLNNLTEKDYTLLRELVKSHTTNGIVDIGKMVIKRIKSGMSFIIFFNDIFFLVIIL